MADQPVTREKLINADIDVDNLGKAVNELGTVNPRYGDPYKTAPQTIQDLQQKADEVIAQGFYQGYATEALLLAAKPAVAEMRARADDTRKIYRWTRTSAEGVTPIAGIWTDTGKSPEDLAKDYTNKKTEPLSKLDLYEATEAPSVVPVLADQNNKILIGYDTEVDQIVAGGLQEQIFNKVPNLMLSTDTNKVAVLVDQNNKILIGYDTLEDKAIIAGLELPNLKPAVKAVNHILFYGQSLSIGAAGNPPLSTSQPYSNITFNSSVRFLNQAATGVKPLSEETGIAALPSTTNQGETACSGAANYASRAMMLENSIAPENHVIFASTGGYGGYRIDQLEKGSAWYPNFINHVVKAKELVGDDYKVQVVCWVQGENDAITSQKTPYATYKQKLEQLQRDTNADIKAITGQADDVKFITYQISYAARTWSAQALAQLHLVQQSDNFALSTPMYHMPYAEDNIHLTNVGYKWMGAYFGRAYKQIVVDNRKTDFINPKSAQIINDEIHIKFDVPKPPLVLDTTTLAITTNHGFRVLVDDVAAVISNITATDNKVIIKLSSPPSGLVKVRYALDHIGTGINLTGGGSGNLRDSTPETIFINGIERPLYHVCPHFELTAFLDKGI